MNVSILFSYFKCDWYFKHFFFVQKFEYTECKTLILLGSYIWSKKKKSHKKKFVSDVTTLLKLLLLYN